jgi:hypothetical protein
LYDQAKALMAAGKAAEACPKLEESERLDPGSGTLLNLALCYEQTGRIASAWTTYRDAAAAARSSGNVDRERGARERAAALAPKVSKLVINVAPSARVPGLVVTRDGVDAGEAQWGVPIPTDEGEHEIVAKAPGHRDWRAKLAVSGAGTTASVAVPKLAPLDATPPPVAIAPLAATQPAPLTPPTGQGTPASQAEQQPSSGLGAQRIVALAAGGVGVAGLAVGAIFGVKAISKKNTADQTCQGTACTSDAGVTAGKDAQAAGNVSTVALIIGAVGVAGGAVLWFAAPSGGNGTQVGFGPSGVVLKRAF